MKFHLINLPSTPASSHLPLSLRFPSVRNAIMEFCLINYWDITFAFYYGTFCFKKVLHENFCCAWSIETIADYV
jgi:hypothetical protein